MLDGEYVRASGLDDVTTDAEATLRAWLRAFAPKLGLPEEPCARCLTVLAELAEAADGVSQLDDFDPAAFSIEKVTGRLSLLQVAPPDPADSAGSVRIVRVQPRAKKNKAKRKR
jgi:hypothetical protein